MPRRPTKPSLSVIPLIPGAEAGRPPPPAALDAIEQRIWRDVVAALPAYWLDPAGQLVLRRLCTQAAIAERREMQLRELRAQDRDMGDRGAELAEQHAATAKITSYLLAQLRATPRSRTVARASGPRIEDAPRALRPWDIRA